MIDADATFNLTALADRLFAERRLLPLANKIRRARDLHSLCSDLVMALESLDALELLLTASSRKEEFLQVVTEAALLNNAIILYVRATKTSSEERRGFDLLSRFTSDEQLAHRELCDLRDKAIAHFGSGGSYAGEWQAELVILQSSGEKVKPGVLTRRKTTDKKLALRARRQIEVASALLRTLTLEMLDEVTEEISRAAAEDADFHREISRHPLNLNIFLVSSNAAEMARSSFDLGEYAKGVVRHS